jgi:hypothetical protein
MTPRLVVQRAGLLAVAVLVTVAVLGLLLAVGSVPHVHIAQGPAFFNPDHDLSYLATFNGATLPPEGAAPIRIAISPLVVLARPLAVSKLPGGHADPRSPPA